jgi:hypothetical protein
MREPTRSIRSEVSTKNQPETIMIRLPRYVLIHMLRICQTNDINAGQPPYDWQGTTFRSIKASPKIYRLNVSFCP